MGNYKKGIETRQHILDGARTIFNQQGLQLTLDQIAQKLKITKGRITNYFPTKDNLFVALSKDYDLRFQQLMESLEPPKTISFSWLADVYASIMDLQHEFRSIIIFAASTHSAQKEMHDQITSSYRANSQQVAEMVKLLVEAKLVSTKLQDPECFEIFKFQHVNLFTTWVVSLEIYDCAKTFHEMKPTYLKGILNCYHPFLTKKGMSQFNQL